MSDAEAQLSDEQAKTMRLEVTLAELQQRLSKMEELEKELEHHRYTALHCVACVSPHIECTD